MTDERRRIPLREVLDPYGVDASTRSHLVTQGLVREAEGKRAPHGVVLVDQAEAQRIARAAAVASQVGTSVSITLRVLKAHAEYFGEDIAS